MSILICYAPKSASFPVLSHSDDQAGQLSYFVGEHKVLWKLTGFHLTNLAHVKPNAFASKLVVPAIRSMSATSRSVTLGRRNPSK